MITAYKRAQRALQESNETLEDQVVQRTCELTALNAELAERKGRRRTRQQAKTRFPRQLHRTILVQPMTAARLFISSVDQGQLSTSAASARSLKPSPHMIAGENLLRRTA